MKHHQAESYSHDFSHYGTGGAQDQEIYTSRSHSLPALAHNFNTYQTPQHHQQPQFPDYYSAIEFQSQDMRGGSSHQVLIDWINSFNDPYCLLVNSLSDLHDGVVLCHVVGSIACSTADQEKIKQLVYYEPQGDQALMDQNLDLAINVLKSSDLPIPDYISQLTPQGLTQDDEQMVLFLETLKQTHDVLGGGQNMNLLHEQPVTVNQDKSPRDVSHNYSQFTQYQEAPKPQPTENTSGRITPRNMPRQLPPKSYSSQPSMNPGIEMNDISPIQERGYSYVMTCDPLDNELARQEEELQRDISQINASYYQKRESMDASKRNSVSGSLTPRRQAATQSQKERKVIQNKILEKKDYSKIIRTSYSQMSNSKIAVNPQSQEEEDTVPEVNLNKQYVKQSQDTSSFIDAKRALAVKVCETKQVKDEDDIMNEMQTLTIRPQNKETTLEPIKVDPVDQKTKVKLLDWLLIEVKLIKRSERLQEQLPQYCRNGVFFFDLINRLNGKHPILKGVDRSAKNTTSILANINKTLEYVRAFPKFCPRYLWASQHIMQGNEDVIWGFLDDIWHWNFNKISPFDPQFNQVVQAKAQSKSPQRSISPYLRPQDNNMNIKEESLIQYPQEQKPPSSKLPPKSNRNNQSKVHNFQPPQPQHHLSVMTIQSKDQMTPRHHSQSVISDSYLPQHKSFNGMKSPLTRHYKDMPLQRQSNHHQSVTSRGTYSRMKSASKSRKRDISYSQTPIAKDAYGTLYYMQDSVDDKNDVISLLSCNDKQQQRYQVTQINEDREKEVNEWLFKHKFHQFLSKEYQHQDIMNDPMSNGLFLSELFCYLEKVDLFEITQFPQSVTECRENLNKIISLIKQKCLDIPPRLLNEKAIECILKRDKQTLYSILYYLKCSYPDVTPLSQEIILPTDNQSSQHLSLPYNKGEVKMLETSILNWIKSLGVLAKLGKDASTCDSLLELQKLISNGTLLCETVSTIFNVKIPGIFKDPKTDSTAISNIRKALEILRRQSKMSQKFTWTEKELFEGKMHVCLGLLEDLHRCFDGLPPRKRGLNYFADGPYLGDTLYNVQPYIKYKADSFKMDTVNTTSNIRKPSDNTRTDYTQHNTVSHNTYEEVPSLFTNVNKDATAMTRQHQSLTVLSPTSSALDISSNRVKPSFANFLNAKLQREQEQARSPLKPTNFCIQKQATPKIYIDQTSDKENQQSQNYNLKHNASAHTMMIKTDISDKYPQPPVKSPLTARREQSVEFEGKKHIRKPSQFQVEDYEDEEHYTNRNIFAQKEKHKVIDWLMLLKVALPQNFDLDRPVLTEFKDGVLLCQIVGLLENSKIESVQLQPKSSAGCLQNIKKALQVLKKKNQIPLYLLYSEEEIQKGNGEIIFQLLKSLRQVYRSKTRFLEEQASKGDVNRSTMRNSTKSRERGDFGTINSDFQDPEDRKQGWPLSPKDRKKLKIPPIPNLRGIGQQLIK